MMVYKFSQHINECPKQIAKGLNKSIFHLAKSMKLVPITILSTNSFARGFRLIASIEHGVKFVDLNNVPAIDHQIIKECRENMMPTGTNMYLCNQLDLNGKLDNDDNTQSLMETIISATPLPKPTIITVSKTSGNHFGVHLSTTSIPFYTQNSPILILKFLS